MLAWLMPGARPRALSMFFGQLQRMSAAGLTPLQALDTLRQGSTRGRLARVALTMSEIIKTGGSYTEAFGACSGVFDPLQIHLIRAAEQSGGIESAFAVLSRMFEQRHQRRQQLVSGLVYPVLVLHLAVLLPPAVRLVTDGVGAYLRSVVPTLAIAYGGLLALVVLWKLLGPAARMVTDRLVLAVPVLRGIVRKLSLARFVTACQGLYEAGVSIGDCLEEAARASGNRVIEGRLLVAARRVRDEGVSATEALAAARVFPPDTMAVLMAGERSGELGSSLGHVAQSYEFEAHTAIDRLLKAAPVLVLLGVGAYVGYLYINTMMGHLREALKMVP